MAYIGVDPNVGDITFQTFTGDGSTTAFTLAQNVVSGEAILVIIGNIVQEPGLSKAYTAQGNTLTFSAAPANGDIIQVRFFGRAVDQPTSFAMQLFKYTATASQTAFTGQMQMVRYWLLVATMLMFTLTGCTWTVQTSRPATEIQSHSAPGPRLMMSW
jgi:hypothetical protein